MKKYIIGVFLFVMSLGFVSQADSQTSLLTIGTGAIKDTIATSNAADTSRQFINKYEYKTILVEIYQSATSVWKTYQIAYPVVGADKFKINYAGNVDSTITISGYVAGEWLQLPIYDYSLTTLSRTLSLPGGGTAWIRFRGYTYEFKL